MKLHTGVEKAVKKQWKSNEQAVEMWNVRELCAIVMYPNAQKELAGEAPHLEHHRTPWKKLWKSNNAQAVEIWKVRKFCAIKMYLNAQKEWLAGEAPHLEHHRTRWEKNDKAMKKK